MALTARSIEISFSVSRLRRTLRSMSIPLPLVPGFPGSRPRGPRIAEFHLYPAWSQVPIGDLAPLSIYFELHRVRSRRRDSALYCGQVPGGFRLAGGGGLSQRGRR